MQNDQPTRREQLDRVAALAEPVRRRLYDVVAGAGEPVDRDTAAVRAGIGRPLAAFHLDRLVRDAEIFAPMVPLTDQTRGLVTAALIDALPRGCLVVLVTRAGICDMASVRRRVLADERLVVLHRAGEHLDVLRRAGVA